MIAGHYTTRHVFQAGEAVPEWVCGIRPRWLSFVWAQPVTVEYDSATRHVEVLRQDDSQYAAVAAENAGDFRGVIRLRGAHGNTMWRNGVSA